MSLTPFRVEFLDLSVVDRFGHRSVVVVVACVARERGIESALGFV